jgi:hypothetical protein
MIIMFFLSVRDPWMLLLLLTLLHLRNKTCVRCTCRLSRRQRWWWSVNMDDVFAAHLLIIASWQSWILSYTFTFTCLSHDNEDGKDDERNSFAACLMPEMFPCFRMSQ